MMLMECKAPAGPRGGVSHRGLTPDQQAWHRAWRGPPVVIARTVEDAIRAAMIEFDIHGDLTPVPSRFDTGEP
jgi:hypothetical protein